MRNEKSALSVLLSVLLIGCGSDTDSEKNSQVVAKVNDTEVTVHQLNYELGLLGQGATQDSDTQGSATQNSATSDTQNSDKGAERALENLVSQQVVAQKAIAEKLDRDPQIMQALEHARRQVLVQAYIKKITERDTTPPGKQEISEYYNQHPELFAKRRIYQIREILLDKTLPIAEIQAKMKDSISLETLVSWLESKKVKMQSGVVMKPAEQLPFEMLARLAQMSQGQVMAVETPANISLSILMATREQPVSEAQATQAIERFLVAQKRKKLAEAEIKRLRSEVKVELLGKFSATTPSTESTPKQSPEQKSNDTDFIEKGAAGL